MISRQEILDYAREFAIGAHIVEKDYTLGWLLTGISNHPAFEANWIFKGGTCLKKAYFETYRFSEDLDFTILRQEQIDEDFLISSFKEILAWTSEKSGIEFPLDLIRFDIYENPRGTIAAEGRISYRGPLQQHEPLPRIRLDLTIDEILVLPTVRREVHHAYSDRLQEGMQINCYCFEEIFAEKMRALAERLRPRDLYDVVHMYRHVDDIEADQKLVHKTLQKKCEFKEITIPTVDLLERKPELEELKSEWENMLAHQLPVLPPFEQFWEVLPEVFEWLYQAVEKEVPASVPVAATDDVTWHPPAMGRVWNTPVPVETIRFAAANRLCVDLKYKDSHRLIEPYSLRRTRTGDLLLYAVKHETGQLRSYRIERIQGATVTKKPFVPRYAIELTASGPISAPLTSRKPDTSKQRMRKSLYKISRRAVSNSAPTFVFECPFCGRKFNRKTNNPRLRQHKDKNGYLCSGRSGFMVKVKY